VTAELRSLLELQADDDVVDALSAKLEALAPRVARLEVVREAAVRALNQARGAADEDEKRQRELERRLSDHKQRQERNLQHLDAVKRMREATAAMMQVESGKKILVEEESELRALVARIADRHAAIKSHEQSLAELDAAQAEERRIIAEEREAIDAELGAARATRDSKAQQVTGSLRAKYDRIRSRRHAQAIFALVDGACGSCDTAIPVQRRTVMSSAGAIDVCEGCGVLLYAAE